MSRGRLAAIAGVVVVAGIARGRRPVGTGGSPRNRPHEPAETGAAAPRAHGLAGHHGRRQLRLHLHDDLQAASDPGAGPVFPASTTSGHGVVNIHPYVMVTTISAGSSFPGVSAVFDSTRVWEFGAGDYGTGGRGSVAASPGNTLPGFAQLVEGSLGQAQGALMMVDISSPSGRLNLDPSMMTAAQQAGTGTVDGVAVTEYRVTIDLWSELNQPTLSAEQRATITDALAILKQQGYEGTTEIVSVDALEGSSGETKTVATFANGGSVSSDNVLSDIGCAGTVNPRRPGADAGPAGVRLTRPAGRTGGDSTTTTGLTGPASSPRLDMPAPRTPQQDQTSSTTLPPQR